MVEKISTH